MLELSSYLFNLPHVLAPKYKSVSCRNAFCRVEILLAKMNKARKICGTHGGPSLPERTPEAKRNPPCLYASKKETIFVYQDYEHTCMLA